MALHWHRATHERDLRIKGAWGCCVAAEKSCKGLARLLHFQHGEDTMVPKQCSLGLDETPLATHHSDVVKLLPATLQDPLDPSQHRQGPMAKANHGILDKTLLTAELDQTDTT